MADQRTTMRNAQVGARVVAQDIMEVSSTQKHRLGERLVLGDRVFRYAKSSTSNLSAGYIAGFAATVYTSKTGASTVVGTAGSTAVTSSCTGATAFTQDQLAEGYLIVTTGSGVGETYKIKSNAPAGTTTTSITLYEPIVSTWTNTLSTHKILQSPYSALVIADTAGAQQVVGVPLIAFTATSYAWVQTWGPCGVMTGAASGGAVGKQQLMLSTTTAGVASYLLVTDTSVTGNALVGQVYGATATNAGEPSAVYLQISC